VDAVYARIVLFGFRGWGAVNVKVLELSWVRRKEEKSGTCVKHLEVIYLESAYLHGT
jgi:hypothetical protein